MSEIYLYIKRNWFWFN